MTRGRKPGGHNRTPAQIELDRATITQYLLRGWKIVNIAEKMKMSRQQIHYEVRIIEKRWRDAQLKNFNEARQQELERINMIEAEAWEAWENSKGERRSSRTRQRTLPPGVTPLGPMRSRNPEDMASLLSFPNVEREPQQQERTEREAMVRIDQRDPDPRFIQIVQWCVERRIQLYGLAPDAVRAPEGAAEEPIRRVVVYMERGAEDPGPSGLPPGPPSDLGGPQVIDVPSRSQEHTG